MTLTPFATTAVAGDVTFTVKNLGTIEHEMVVLKTDTPFDKLPIADSGDPPVPVNSGADKVDEADNVAETGEPDLQPGDTRTFTATGLAPGNYVLVCNIAKHYGLGIRAAFTVTGTAAPTTTTPATTGTTTAAAPTTTAPPGTVAVTASDTKGLNGPMTLVPSTNSAPAGDVTFVVKNTGTIEHEMIVLKTDTPFDEIPITDSGDPPVPVSSGADKIDEADSVGETGEPNLQPGDTRTFTLSDLGSGQLRAGVQHRQALRPRHARCVHRHGHGRDNGSSGSHHGRRFGNGRRHGERHQGTQRPDDPGPVDEQRARWRRHVRRQEHGHDRARDDRAQDRHAVRQDCRSADSGDPPAPVNSGADKIDEADNIGETGDPNLQPGDTRTFTITGLGPGNYVLVCNIAKHYGLGMRAAFKVT